MVDGEGALQPVGGDPAGGPEPAHVVDEHVQARVRVQNLAGQPSYLRLGGHVGGERVDCRVAGRGGDVGRRGSAPGEIAAGDADAGAQRGQAGGRGFAVDIRSPGAGPVLQGGSAGRARNSSSRWWIRNGDTAVE